MGRKIDMHAQTSNTELPTEIECLTSILNANIREEGAVKERNSMRFSVNKHTSPVYAGIVTLKETKLKYNV